MVGLCSGTGIWARESLRKKQECQLLHHNTSFVPLITSYWATCFGTAVCFLVLLKTYYGTELGSSTCVMQDTKQTTNSVVFGECQLCMVVEWSEDREGWGVQRKWGHHMLGPMTASPLVSASLEIRNQTPLHVCSPHADMAANLWPTDPSPSTP